MARLEKLTLILFILAAILLATSLISLDMLSTSLITVFILVFLRLVRPSSILFEYDPKVKVSLAEEIAALTALLAFTFNPGFPSLFWAVFICVAVAFRVKVGRPSLAYGSALLFSFGAIMAMWSLYQLFSGAFLGLTPLNLAILGSISVCAAIGSLIVLKIKSPARISRLFRVLLGLGITAPSVIFAVQNTDWGAVLLTALGLVMIYSGLKGRD